MVPILISDDKSPESDAMRKMADDEGVDYVCSDRRRSHFSGDWQAFINSLVYAEQEGGEVAVKISQRVIPVLPEFWDPVLQHFKSPDVHVIAPGRLNKNQIARPTAGFYLKFGVLTDLVAMRVGKVLPSEIAEFYRARVVGNDHRHASLVELTWGQLLGSRFRDNHRLVPEWTNHEPFKPKLFLRKSQSTAAEYAQLAGMEGLKGNYDLREWIQIEGRSYVPKPHIV